MLWGLREDIDRRSVSPGLFFAAATLAVAACAPAPDVDAVDPGGSCIESRTPVALTEQTPLGLAPATLLTLAEGSHSQQLGWAGGGTTKITLSVDASKVTAFFVDSERNPAMGVVLGISCDDWIELNVAATLATDDGKLDEKWSSVALDFTPRAELAPDGGWTEGWLGGSRKLEAGNIGGTYAPSVPPGHCLLDALVAFRLRPGNPLAIFSGAVQRLVAEVPCNEMTDVTAAVPILDATW